MAALESIKDTVLIRDRIYEMLRKEILNGGFAPGETLNILNISKQLGVSGAPVREALTLLNKDGLVDMMPYKKARVAEGSLEDYKVAYDVRLMLEPYALERSIDLIPEDEIKGLRARMLAMYDNPTSISDFYDCDTAFHRMLYSHSESSLLTKTLDSLKTYTTRFYAYVNHEQKLMDDPWETTIETIRVETREHLLILEAVSRRNKEAACSLLREHISTNSVVLVEKAKKEWEEREKENTPLATAGS